MVGAMQYLIMTGPKIAFVIHVGLQFMHVAHIPHMHDVKHIFRSVQSTTDHG